MSHYIIWGLWSMLALGCIVNIVPNVYDILRTSSYLSTSYFVVIIGAWFILQTQKKIIQINIVDIFFLIVCSIVLFAPSLNKLYNCGNYCLLFLYIAMRIADKKINYVSLFVIILAMTLLLAIIGYLQYFELIASNNEYFKITGAYYNPAIYSNMLSLFLSVIAVFVIYSWRSGLFHKWKIVSLIIICISLPILLLTNARASWIALLLPVCYFIFFNWLKQKKAIKKITLALMTTIFLILSGIFLYHLKPDSAQGRLLIWKISSEMIKDKPISGHGTDGFRSNYMLYQKDYFEKQKASVKEVLLAGNNWLAYNEPIRITVEYGIVGLIIYLLFCMFILRIKENALSLVLLKTFLLTWIVQGFFSYPAQIFPIMMWLTIMSACLANRITSKITIIKLPQSSLLILKAFVGIACIALISYTLWIHRHYHDVHSSIVSLSQEKNDEALYKLSELVPALKNNVGIGLFYMRILYKTEQYSTCLKHIEEIEKLYINNNLYLLKGECYKHLEMFEEAEKSYWDAHYCVPSQQRARARLALLYKDIDRYAEGKALADEILNEKVKVYGFGTYELHKELKMSFMD